MEVKGDVDDHLLSVNTKSDLQGCARWADFLRCYALLGFISFGGPQSHMAVLKDQVERRFWLSKESFGELYSLCSAIPGPSSSQLATAVGVARMGWTGGLIGYLLFLLPGFTMMMILGSLAGHYFADGFQPPFYLSALELGLSCAALVLIGSNAMSLGKSLCTHRVTQLICLAGEGFLIVCPFFSSENKIEKKSFGVDLAVPAVLVRFPICICCICACFFCLLFDTPSRVA